MMHKMCVDPNMQAESDIIRWHLAIHWTNKSGKHCISENNETPFSAVDRLFLIIRNILVSTNNNSFDQLHAMKHKTI